jgi:hypothetical protein
METQHPKETMNQRILQLVVAKEKERLQKDIAGWFENIKKHTAQIPEELPKQVALLKNIRKELYEDLNQLQHAAMILEVAEKLQIEYPEVDQWSWHPKQTSDPEYSDLTGWVGMKVYLNAEVTTSLRPVGTIDQRMSSTLRSLNKKQGMRFYFVATNEMFSRAISKQRKSGYDIRIRLLEIVGESFF